MRLYLAVAVLMLAFVAYTEAQEETIEEKFSKFGQHVTEVGKNIADKARTTFEDFQTSDLYVNSRNWMQERLERLKKHFGDMTQ